MKSVTVEFTSDKNIDSFVVGNPACVNGIDGTITNVINEVPPIIPVALGDYFPLIIEMSKGAITSGTINNLKTKDKNYLIISSETANYGNIIEASFTFQMNGKVLPNLTIATSERTSRLSVIQAIRLFNYNINSWNQIESRSIGYSVVDINTVVNNPNQYISSVGEIKLKLTLTSGANFNLSLDCLKLVVK